jgi:hypothetical protein
MRLPQLRRWLPAAVMVGGAALSLPPLRPLIEQSMVWHMLVQMPLLVLGGWLVAGHWRARQAPALLERFNRFGLTGFIVTTLVAGYWMIPSTIDRAVVMPGTDVAKIITLWLCGAALRHSMQRAPLLVQLFFLGYTLPMMVWLGLYYATADLRLCNAYSLESQLAAGNGLVVLASAAGAVWLYYGAAGRFMIEQS